MIGYLFLFNSRVLVLIIKNLSPDNQTSVQEIIETKKHGNKQKQKQQQQMNFVINIMQNNWLNYSK